MNSVKYEVRVLKTYEESMDYFPKKAQKRINKKIEEILVKYPYRYNMLKGIYLLRGISLVGLRKFKTGLEGHRGGVYVLYRICKECRENGYHQKSGICCEFCDDGKEYRIVLFFARPRELGY